MLFRSAYDSIDRAAVVEMLDAVKSLGYHWAARSGISFGVKSIIIPPEKAEITEATRKEDDVAKENYEIGLLTRNEYLAERGGGRGPLGQEAAHRDGREGGLQGGVLGGARRGPCADHSAGPGPPASDWGPGDPRFGGGVVIIARVIGHVWATKKDESLNGMKFFVVHPVRGSKDEIFVAVDAAGAGIGDNVLISQGSSARMLFDQKNLPVDAVIVGIIDTVEVDASLLEFEP